MPEGIHQILGALGEARQLLHQRRGAVMEAHLARLSRVNLVEKRSTRLSSDIHHFGDPLPLVTRDLIGPSLAAMEQIQQGPLAGYLP